MANRRPVRTDRTRVWLIDGGAGPSRAPVYLEFGKAGAVRWPAGEPTNAEAPDPDNLGRFVVIDSIEAADQRPQLPITNRYLSGLSDLFAIRRGGCAADVQVHIGTCEDPRNFNEGWASGKVVVLEQGRITEYATTDLGAMQSSERAIADENATLSGEDSYEIGPMTYAAQAAAEITVEGIDVALCDRPSCAGLCGAGSDGCQNVFVLTLKVGGSPADSAEIVFTSDGGSTWADSEITSMDTADDPDAVACAGSNLVVVSEDSESLHYAATADIIAGTEAWAEVTTGFVALKGPRDIFALSQSLVWIVGAGGYVYFSDDITSGVEVQSAGGATTEVLNAIHGSDSSNLVAVGANNAVIYTTDGGETWALVTGPAAGVVLNTVWMRSATEWLVGTANGRLWFTEDSGVTWTEKGFPGSGTAGSQVRDLVFSSPTVGYMAHDLSTPRGRILRTVDGGFSWYVAPEGTASMPLADRFNALAVCANPNRVFAAGLGDDGSDGIIVKGAA